MKRRLDETSPKIKMSDIHDDRDDDIIELSDEELKVILGFIPVDVLTKAEQA
ncbi:MAG: hypothetical protein IJC37_05075 [Clostridia bacterium]|nr:hypothetical protein [Clostridia bacterium]